MSNCGGCGIAIASNKSLCSDCETECYEIFKEEYEKRKAEGAGIEVYEVEQMEDELNEATEKLVDKLKERIEIELGFTGEFDESYEIKSKSKGTLLKFKRKNKGLRLEYNCEEMEGDRGEVATCELCFKIKGKVVEKTYFEMTNADYEEDGEDIMPMRKFELNDSSGDEFINRIMKAIRMNR